MKRVFKLIVIIGLLLTIVGCEKNIEDYELSEESKLLYDIVQNLYSDELKSNNKPIVTIEQKNSNVVLSELRLNIDMLESYALIASSDKIDTIAIVKSKLRQEDKVIMGLTARYNTLMEESGPQDSAERKAFYSKFIFEQVGDYFVFIIHDNAESIYKEIVKGISSQDASKVETLIN